MATETQRFDEEALGKRQDTALLRRILPYASPFKARFALSFALVLLITLLDISIPYVTKITIDRYIVPPQTSAVNDSETVLPDDTTHDARRLYRADITRPETMAIVNRYPDLFSIQEQSAIIDYRDLSRLSPADHRALRAPDYHGVALMAAVLLCIVILNFIFIFWQAMVMEYTGQMMMHRLRVDLFIHIQQLSMPFFNRNPVGRLVTRVTNDIQNLHELFTSVISFFFKDIFLLAGITIVLLAIHLKLAIICLLLLPFILFTAHRFANIARDAFRTLRVKIAEINTRFSETVQGIRVIQLFRKETLNFQKFSRLNHDHYLAGMQQVKVFAVFMPLIELLATIAVAIVIYFGGSGVLQNSISLGALVAFISYMRMFFRPIRDIAEKYNILQNAMSSAERIMLILDTESDPAAEQSSSGKTMDSMSSLEFDRVSFSYDAETRVLNNISFRLNAGETIAVVGPTGAGKTSLINLIVRFYDPTDGVIRVNGRNIHSYAPAALRRRIAIVPQDPFLFSGTVRDNIFPHESPSEERITEVLEAASCSSLIKKLPDGIDTRLSEGGASLSSGERQLLSIARAFAKAPDLIILDEATSYVDSASEEKIQQALNKLLEAYTAIIIAHRLSTARNADRILTLHHGKIIESGSHEDLMANKGFYYQLNRLDK